MAVECKVLSFSAEETTGNKAYTGFGFQPQALIFIGTRNTANTTKDGLSVCYGIATGPSNEFCLTGWAGDNLATTSTGRRLFNNSCLNLFSKTAIEYTANLVSLDADGFTLNWTNTAEGTGHRFTVMALAGLDNAKADTILSETSTGNKAYTGWGFQPDVLLAITGATPNFSTNTDLEFSVGVTDGTNEAYSSGRSTAGQSTASCVKAINNDAFIDTYLNSVGITELKANIVSLDSDGFTLNWTQVDASQQYVAVLALGGCQAHVGDDTTPTSTGTKSTTGVGFQPVGLVTSNAVNLSFSSGSSDDIEHGYGFASAATERAHGWTGDTFGAGTTVTKTDEDEALVVKVMRENGTVFVEGDLDSFDSDGFTIDYSTVTGTNRVFWFLAIGDAAAGDVSGTIAQTLPSFVQDAVTAVAVSGTIAQSLPSLSQAAVATVDLSASVAQTVPGLTQSASASVSLDITTAQTFPSLTQSAVATGGENALNGVQTLPNLIQAAVATVDISATVAQALPGVSQAATATALVQAQFALTSAALTQSATAAVTAPAGRTINGAQALPSLSQAAVSTVSLSATASQTLPSLTQSAVSIVDVSGTIAQALPSLAQAAVATVDLSASVAQTLPSLAQSAVSTVSLSASVAQALPSLVESATATVSLSATAAQTLPSLTQSAVATGGANLITGAQTLPSLAQAAVTTVDVSGTIAQTLPGLTQSASASVSLDITAAQTFPGLTQAAVATVSLSVAAAQTLPSVTEQAISSIGGRIIIGSQLAPSATQAVVTVVDVSLAGVQTAPIVQQTLSAAVSLALSSAQAIPIPKQTVIALSGTPAPAVPGWESRMSTERSHARIADERSQSRLEEE